MKQKNQRKVYYGIVLIALLLLFLYFKGADLYYFVNYGCAEAEYHRTSYQGKWGVDMPVSKVLFHGSKGVGWDGGGVTYTVFGAEKENADSSF